jgi:hypothetical protein
VGFELTTLVVIDTNCIGGHKSNYHTITTTRAPKEQRKHVTKEQRKHVTKEQRKHVIKEQRKPFVLELVEQHISKLQMTEEFENIKVDYMFYLFLSYMFSLFLSYMFSLFLSYMFSLFLSYMFTKEQRKPFVLELVEQHISKLQMTEEFENIKVVIRALVVVIVW